MEAKVYNQEGKEVSTVILPEAVFGLSWNGDLVHQVMTSMVSNARVTLAHTKDRGDVRGGGKKPWRQKGTGRARHGSRRSPLWVGGGVTFGPTTDRNFEKKVNRKSRVRALNVVLSQKLRDGEILFVDKLALSEIKTATAKAIVSTLSTIPGFEGLATKKRHAACIYLPERNEAVQLSFRNMGNMEILDMKNMNPLDITSCKYLVVADPETSVRFLEGKLAK